MKSIVSIPLSTTDFNLEKIANLEFAVASYRFFFKANLSTI